MKIIRIGSGLGNQMFQYALYRSFLLKSIVAKVDVVSRLSVIRHQHEFGSLFDVFGNAERVEANSHEIAQLSDNNRTLFHKVKRRLIGLKKTHFFEKSLPFDAKIFSMPEDLYLQGYWQTEKYFKDCESDIRAQLRFPQLNDSKNLELLNLIQQSNSVGIHVRKGSDYQTALRSGLCNATYYIKATEFIEKRVKNPTFFIFTDNKTWVLENLKIPNMKIIDHNPTSGIGNYLDMQLMASCKSNIIANSSYSWWAAWLNPNPLKIVIGPEKWFNFSGPEYDSTDIMPSQWISL